MHVTKNVKSPNNISEWQMGFNSAFKGLIEKRRQLFEVDHYECPAPYRTRFRMLLDVQRYK